MSISPLRRAAAAAAVAAVGATAILPGSPASAQATCYPPTANCVTTTTRPAVAPQALTLALSDTTVTRGQTITASVTGFAGGSTVTLSILSVEQQLGTFVVSAGGTGSRNITIPSNISLGAHTIFARGTASNGTAGSVSRAVTVVAVSTGGVGGGGLARTGAVVVPAALVGLGLVAGGAALKRSSRRSKTSSAG